MIDVHTRKQFEGSIIAQHDDEDYDESGWVACVVGDQAALASYGHCSCYGTWESINGGGISDYFGDNQVFSEVGWTWTGTVEELIALAERGADPSMPERESSPDDCDHDHLVEVYRQIKEWANARRANNEAS